jgi:ribosomal protein S8
LIYLYVSNPVLKNDQADPIKSLSKNYKPCDSCEKPDIYFILFDGYTNSKTLNREFGYKNDFIENKLKADGFFVPSNSNSNYNFTHMSLGSELNLDYLSHLDNTHRFYTKDFFRANYTIFHNEFCEILKKQGYQINNYSIFDIKNAPVKITPAMTQLSWRSVLGQTFFNKLRRDIGWHLIRFYPENYVPSSKKRKIETDVKRVAETFNGIITALKNPPQKPQFLYAHFLMPHETYYFDSTGKRLDISYTSNAPINRKDYVQQVAYVNKFLMAPVVDSIFKYARRPFIIIIQGDHGYRAYPPDKVNLEFQNFGSVYFPDKDYAVFHDSLSSVNTFRFVLNKYFHEQMPLLKDTMINLYKKNSD